MRRCTPSAGVNRTDESLVRALLTALRLLTAVSAAYAYTAPPRAVQWLLTS